MAAHRLRTRLKRAEWAARWLVLGLAVGLPLAAVGARALEGSESVIEIHARVAEDGGWVPGDFSVAAGQPVRLRLVSDDVVHGFAVGQSDAPAVDLPPGQVVETTLTLAQPGTYTYYCTRWCGLNHWRMRGTITVSGTEAGIAPTPDPPLYVRLGLNPDAPHPAPEGVLPSRQPISANGADWAEAVPPALLTRTMYETTSPAAVWQQLRAASTTQGLSDTLVWDLVAWVWTSYTTPAELSQGRDLYAANCAACHGEAGAGDGVFAATLEQQGHTALGHGTQAPADFTDSTQMLGASCAVLHGKLLRGGMGTGMPAWGMIFTERQLWTLIDYLWSLQFDYGDEGR
jgi:mono/diheme cytochrome c family protein/plastocyanin